MFCPTCGAENSHERQYCALCGTNLGAVSQALSGSADPFLNKLDTSLDQFIARYAEHIFKDAPIMVLDRSVSRSWKILGQGLITSLVDLLLFSLMCVILPFRLLLLLVWTPIGLVTERSRLQQDAARQLDNKQAIDFPNVLSADSPRSLVPSVTEHTTRSLHKSDRIDSDLRHKD
jgi:hypothetical protein